MGKADVDLDTVIAFCDEFDKEYISLLKNYAQKLKIAASSASETLNGTQMATNASNQLEIVAEAILKAVQTGEERILELKRKMQNELEKKNHIEDMCR